MPSAKPCVEDRSLYRIMNRIFPVAIFVIPLSDATISLTYPLSCSVSYLLMHCVSSLNLVFHVDAHEKVHLSCDQSGPLRCVPPVPRPL